MIVEVLDVDAEEDADVDVDAEEGADVDVDADVEVTERRSGSP